MCNEIGHRVQFRFAVNAGDIGKRAYILPSQISNPKFKSQMSKLKATGTKKQSLLKVRSPRQLEPSVPSDLERIIAKAMARDLKRYARAGELYADLRALQASLNLRP